MRYNVRLIDSEWCVCLSWSRDRLHTWESRALRSVLVLFRGNYIGRGGRSLLTSLESGLEHGLLLLDPALHLLNFVDAQSFEIWLASSICLLLSLVLHLLGRL